MALDFEYAFKYMFFDQKCWRKLLWGGLAFFFPPLLCGYFLEMVRKVILGEDINLPDWSEWKRYIRIGFKVILISLIYLLPAVVMSAGGIVCSYFLFSSFSPSIFSVIGIIDFLFILMAFLSFLWALVMLPVVLADFAYTQDWKDVVKYKRTLGNITANLQEYLYTVFNSWAIGIVILVVAFPILPWSFFYFLTISAELYGQFYEEWILLGGAFS